MNVSIANRSVPLSFSLPFRGRAGVGASGASIARSARPHPNLGAGSQRLPLFGLSSSAQAELKPQPSAPEGEGATP
ncbi:hypothetical protein SAMN05444748_105129 [Variovorax sp. OV700]|nr:hypothetical protein SAMN05444748_105129 [Variovorax sp. OV700]